MLGLFEVKSSECKNSLVEPHVGTRSVRVANHDLEWLLALGLLPQRFYHNTNSNTNLDSVQIKCFLVKSPDFGAVGLAADDQLILRYQDETVASVKQF